MDVVDIQAVEARLETAGIPFERTFDWDEGWAFFVDGDLMAQGASIGALEEALAPWWRAYVSGRQTPEADSPD